MRATLRAVPRVLWSLLVSMTSVSSTSCILAAELVLEGLHLGLALNELGDVVVGVKTAAGRLDSPPHALGNLGR